MQSCRNRIDLRLLFLDQVRDESLLGRYRELLTEEERRQELRFRLEVDRRRYLGTRALVRTALSRYVPIGPEAWRFSTDRYGRPRLVNADERAQEIEFNISHTDGLIVLAVTFGGMIGVDVENSLRPGGLEVGERFFSRVEAAALTGLPANIRQARFFEYWTLKESYVKARGLGLSIPLDQFRFRFEGENRVDFLVSPRLDDEPSRWRFWQFRPSTVYVMSLCASRPAAAGRGLRIRRVVPLCGEEAVTCPILRASA